MDAQRRLIEGNPLLIVVDTQGGPPEGADAAALPLMPGYGERMVRAPALIAKACANGVDRQ